MEFIEIKPDDFSVYLSEKDKLYNYYGKNYRDKLPEIYEKLTSILNSDMLFTNLIEKGLTDKKYQEEALEALKLKLLPKVFNFDEESINKINQVKSISEITDRNILEKINNSKDGEYFDILYSIVRILYDNYISYLLHVYISNKEPALGNSYGVEDIKDCDFIIERYHNYIEALNSNKDPSNPNIDELGNVVFEKGDLFHGTTYSEEIIRSIATKGLESGQLHDIVEDGETFFCVDFFKNQKEATPEEICKFGKDYTDGSSQIVFVINNSDVDGPNAKFPDITDYDAYNETTEKGRMAREIVNEAGLPLDKESAAAIIIGVPPCMISSIVVNSDIENDNKKIDFISVNFPKAYIVSRHTGKVIKKPIIDKVNNNHALI